MKKLLYLFCPLGILILVSFTTKTTFLKSQDIIYALPERLSPKAIEHQLNPNISNQIILDTKGSILHIPKDAFVDLNGNTITTDVTIRFLEYRNAADMAFSKIPMTYKGNNFNSSGMFDIQGYSEGQAIRIASDKKLSLDYTQVQDNRNTNFYRLNDKTNQWEFISNIDDKGKPLVVVPSTVPPPPPPPPPAISETVEDEEYWEEDDLDEVYYENYGEVVEALSIAEFGVYNCDQIYKLENPVNIIASYIDETGKPIHDLYSLSLIDLGFNAAFSFSPNRFTCNYKSNNILLLLDKSGQVFLLDENQFANKRISKNGEYQFTLKNISNEFKNTTELAAYLGLS